MEPFMMTYADADAAAITVESGVVKYVDVLLSLEGVLILEIGTCHKYPEWAVSGHEIWLHPEGPEFPSPRDGGIRTVVRLPPRTEEWLLLTEAMKYGLFVTALPWSSLTTRTSAYRRVHDNPED
jgi:hypothetical protein